ncbi:MAG TPA: FAD:protein FMN transferase [Candidatus Polarisedimenticolaceae bacterium]|nr:FAD:protein FMN transferase [Candidatus Polarisedimenticolaceae bacterium]
MLELLAISRPVLAEPVERARYLMGTRCSARAFGDEASVGPALDAALERIARLEDAMTTFRADGELARLNAACAAASWREPVAVSADLFAALDGALRWARATEGSFDPTVGALAAAWGLQSGGRRPTAAEVSAALSRTSWRWVELDRERRTVRCLRQGVALDLGGFGKGFALDAAAEVLHARGVESALIDFGGQVLALGAPPGEPGWIVELADPRERQRPVLSLRVRDASVSTSGNSEHPGHLLDPATGAVAALRGSVSVIAGNAGAADALSTALAVSSKVIALLPRDVQFLYLEPPAEPSGRFRARASRSLRPQRIESEPIAWRWE